MESIQFILEDDDKQYFYTLTNMIQFKGCFCAHILNSKMTSRLTGQREDRHSDGLDACFIRAPPGVAEFLRCEVADGLSCLMVTGLEELVSRVIRVKVLEGACLHFPVTVVVPFCARYRGSYRDIAVKVVDDGGRTCYITPVATEGTYGGQRVSFLIFSLFLKL